jgi:hypothetical protein
MSRALLALLLLAGCALPDQRTFTRTPVAPGAAEAARARLAAYPLVTIALPSADPAWPRAVADALSGAQSRQPGAQFDILAPVPLAASDAATAAAVARGTEDARSIAEALGRQGVPPERLHLGLQGEAGSPPREVRIYLR